MKRFNIALWVSCLALMALIASCGGSNIGSPIQDDLNADNGGELAPPPYDPALDPDNEAVEEEGDPAPPPFDPALIPDEELGIPPVDPGPDPGFNPQLDEKAASYLPGGFAWCYSGVNTLVDNHFNYTSRWGSVIETVVGPVKTVHLRSSSDTIAGIKYWFKKGPNVLPGERIRRLEFHGTGKQLQVHLYNFSTGAYDPYVTFNLDDAPMLGFWPYINVGAQHVDTSGRVVAEVRSKLLNYNKIVSIRTDVY